LWLVLLKASNRMPGRSEHTRMLALVNAIPETTIRSLLSLPAVDSLMNLSPPLETVLSEPLERLYPKETNAAIKNIRHRRNIDPKSALVSLGEILKRIRNRREHGFKTPDGPRDSEILAASRTILESFGVLALEAAAREVNAADGASSNGIRCATF
jgi:hypothetical protein